jgi:hypothetical protein
MKRIIFISLLIASPALAAQPDDALWQQLIGSQMAQCSQNLVDEAREIAKLKEQVAELQKQLALAKAKETPNAK